MKKETFFLKSVIVLIGAIVLGLCLLWLPGLAYRTFHSNLVLFSFVMIMYVSAIPFWLALYQAFKILKCIDDNEAFSNVPIKALKNIRNCSIVISGLYTLGLPLLYVYADREDAPGIILVGMFIVFVSFTIAVFAAVLQKVFVKAMSIKSENDSTV